MRAGVGGLLVVGRLAAVRVLGLWLAALCLLALAPVGAGAFSSSAYVVNFISSGAGGISQYDVGTGGALSPKATPTVAAGNGPFAIAVSPDGKSVYVTNGNTNGPDAPALSPRGLRPPDCSSRARVARGEATNHAFEGDDAPARELARVDVPTIEPDAPVTDALAVLDSFNERRPVVIDPEHR